MRLIWSPLAVEKVRDIAEYIALDKPFTAERWANDIFDSVGRLVELPQSGRIVPEIKRSDIREISKGNYRIIYKVKESTILILTVKSYRQLLKSEEIQP